MAAKSSTGAPSAKKSVAASIFIVGHYSPGFAEKQAKKAPPPDFMTTFDDVGPCGVLGGFSLGVVFLFCEQNTAGG